MDNKRKFLEKIYGYPFPESFFQFYEFTQNLPPDSITGLESTLSISLEEVFQIFDPDLDTNEFDPLKSSRYYNDPPEFFTIMRGHTDGLHWGYYLDDPKHPEKIFVAKFYANDAYTISHEGYSLFEAFRFELELIYEGVKTNLKDDPKSADIYLEQLNQIETIREILMNYATGNRQEIGWDYDDKYNIWLLKERINTREGLGIYVPPDLYRPLPGEDKFQIWNYQPTPEEVVTLYTNAMNAIKEGFPGTALKAGKDLWIYHEYFDTTYKLLNAAYEALDRLLLCRTLKLAKEFREECDRARQ